MEKMSVSAIVVNYYTSIYLPELLNDLAALKDIEQIFIVDNSGDIDYSLDRQSSKIEIIKPGKNLGFGAGVNLAASKASSEHLLVINPDVRLFPNCLEHLLDAALKYGSVLTGPRFFWDNDKKYRLPPSQGSTSSLDYAVQAANKNRLEFEHLSFYWQMRHERFWSSTRPFAELFISGACVLINREWAVRRNLSSIFDNRSNLDNRESSVFDERFFLYFEDNDISLRAYFEGKLPLCVPDAEALHHYDQSPQPEEGKGSLMAKSHALFAQKYYGDIRYTLDKPVSITDYYLPEIEDIGQITAPFSCDLRFLDIAVMQGFGVNKSECKQYFGNIYFEIGVNPFFVPFAQTEISEQSYGIGMFKIDDSIWEKLAKGLYYTRIRDSIKGTLKVWKLEKA
ncbi:MAG: glycosyltransferase [Desulfamplus sp.]|nr:glycosyltransferase [Desulfamplus sp.]